MPSSISTVWGTTVAFTLHQLMTIIPISLIFVPSGSEHPDCSKLDTSNVSGFYGPGALLALFAALTSTMLRYEIPLQPLLDSTTSYTMPWETTMDEFHIIELDKTLGTALGSLIIAELDLIIRTIRKEPLDGRLAAALALTSTAFCVSQIGVLSSANRFWVDRRQGISRTAAWLLVWIISFIALLLVIIRLPALLEDIILISGITTFTTSSYTIVLWNRIKKAPIWVLLVLPALGSSVLLLGSAFWSIARFQLTGEMGSSKCRAFPGMLSLTSTSLKDMDQLAAFVLAFGLCWFDGLFYFVRRLLKGATQF